MKKVFRAPSIRRQLVVRILSGTSVMLFVAGSIFLGYVHRQLVQNFDQILESQAGMLVRNSERKGNIIVWDVPNTYTAASLKDADAGYCQLFLKDGTTVGISQSLGVDDLPLNTSLQNHTRNMLLPNGQHGRLIQKTYRPKSEELEIQDQPEDPHEQTFQIPASVDATKVELVLVVARSRGSLDRLLVSLYLAGIAVALVLSTALAWLVRREITRALRPIEEINAQISLIAPEALATRIHVPFPPIELAEIEATVNRLLGRVEHAFERERRFSNDLAHEMRTPVAELRTACEVGGRWPDDPVSARQFFQDTGEIALHLEKVIGTLLTLSRSDTAKVHPQRIELRQLVTVCWQRAVASGMQDRLLMEIAPELTVECDKDLLEIVLRNLIENAVSHSEPTSQVSCGCMQTDAGLEFYLANDAPNLLESDLVHVFDRFWRKDSARTDRRHVGLGLSIVKELCEILGLELRVNLGADKRFTVTICLPNSPLSTS